jgi:hypothetical protein
MKKLLAVLVVVLVLVAVGVVFLLGNLGEIIRGVVEKVGTEATQAPVTLQTVDLSLTDGKGELQNLVVGNPEGFTSAHAMKLDLVRVVIDTSSIQSDPVVIKEIVVDGPEVIFEVASGGTNIGKIQEAVEQYAARLPKSGEEPPAEEPEPAPEGEGKKLIIENLYVRNVSVQVVASFLGDKSRGATIKEIHLKDVGKAEGGVTGGEVAALFLEELLNQVVEAVADLEIEGLKDQLKEKSDGLLEKAGKSLGGLFGGDDDEEEEGGKKKRRNR